MKVLIFRVLASDVFVLVTMSIVTSVTAWRVFLVPEKPVRVLWIVGVMIFVNLIAWVWFWLYKRQTAYNQVSYESSVRFESCDGWISVASGKYGYARWLDDEPLLTNGPVDWDKPPIIKV